MAQTALKQVKVVSSYELSKRITTSRLFSKVDLTPCTKLTLRCLLDFRNHKTGLTFPKQTTIAEATGLTKTSISRAIEELRKAKLIITVKYNGRLHYSFTNFFYELLKEPEETIATENIKSETSNNQPSNKVNYNSITYITNSTKQIKETKVFQNSKSKAETQALLKQYEQEKQTAVSPFDNRDCAIDVLKTILKPATLQHAFARKMFKDIQTVWNFDVATLEQIKIGEYNND